MPDRELGARVEAVLKLGQLVEEAVRDAVGRILGDPLEPDERRAYALPEMRDGFCIAPRLVPSNRPLHPRSIICGRDRRRPGWALGGSTPGSAAGALPLISSSAPAHVLAPAQRPQHEQDRAEADRHVHDRRHELLAEAEGEDRRARRRAGEREDEDRLLRAGAARA